MDKSSPQLLSMVSQVIKNRLSHFTLRGHKMTSEEEEHNKVVMAGSFNPVHDGHLGMAQSTLALVAPQAEIVYELGVYNPDKPDLSQEEVLRRMEPFLSTDRTIKVSRSRLYFETNHDYRHSWMCLGYDTIIRVFMEKYYPRGQQDIRQGFQDIRQHHNKLVVLGRLDPISGHFLTFQQYIHNNQHNYIGALYEEFKDIFIEIGEEQFRIDISSTQIRQRNKQ